MSNNFASNVETLSVSECASLISAVGDSTTVVVRGEPGTGKSSILKLLREMHGDAYEYVYVDCPTIGDGDMGANIPVTESKTMEFFAAGMLKLDSDKPVIYMLDEYLKVNKLMKTIFTRLILDREIGDRKLPDGSIVFATSNLASDNVNDTKGAHEQNRIIEVEMTKPDHRSWGVWATNRGLTALIRAWVSFKPKALHSYRKITADELRDNEFIFNPSKPIGAFVSPRSLEKADNVLRQRSVLGDKVVKSALAGVVGAAAAESIMMFAHIERDLVQTSAIVKDPENVRMPDSVGALMMTLFHGVDELQTQDELAAYMRFMKRVKSEEYRGVFLAMLCESKRTARMALQNREVNEWYRTNHKLI